MNGKRAKAIRKALKRVGVDPRTNKRMYRRIRKNVSKQPLEKIRE